MSGYVTGPTGPPGATGPVGIDLEPVSARVIHANALLLAPHDDDQALFAAAVCMRHTPIVVVVTDSYVQPNRGEIGCSADERAAETVASCGALGCAVLRCGIRDDASLETITVELWRWLRGCANFDQIYAPALQGGHPHHDLVSWIAGKIGPRVSYYTTYTRTELWTTGNLEVILTPDEHRQKVKALNAHASQVRINRPHFDAVMGKNEWLISG